MTEIKGPWCYKQRRHLTKSGGYTDKDGISRDYFVSETPEFRGRVSKDRVSEINNSLNQVDADVRNGIVNSDDRKTRKYSFANSLSDENEKQFALDWIMMQ
jgi:hypothetical protein